MFEKFKRLSPLAQRAILALTLFGIMFIDLLFPKNDFTVDLFFASGIAWIWAIGLLRPLLAFVFFIIKAVLRYKSLE